MKSQAVRLVDVLLIGPGLVYAATRTAPPAWLRVGLVVTGVATVLYNLHHYLERERRG